MTYQQIWAPWRLSYLKKDKGEPTAEAAGLPLMEGGAPGCFLCQAAADSCNRDRHVVQRTDYSVTVLNRYPYNNGHLLVAPLVHKGRLGELDLAEHVDLAKALTGMVSLLENVLSPEGFNIGLNLGQAAGAGLPDHLHWHIVPRWDGDTNFMPSLAGVKVIPQSLDALWEALTEAVTAGK